MVTQLHKIFAYLRSFNAVAAVFVLSASLLVFWAGMRSGFGDWFISETHADILYSSVHYFHEFPYFSYFLNGGSYLVQDPQTFFLSPTALTVLLFGPTTGLRVMLAVWTAIGTWSLYLFLKLYVRPWAALTATLAWTLSGVFLWRIVIGNDMFFWHHALPIGLLIIRYTYTHKKLFGAWALGLFVGIFLLGPTVHSTLYFFAPALIMWWIYMVATCLQEKTINWKFVWQSILITGAVVFIVVLPKLVLWSQFTFQRTTLLDGTIRLQTAIAQLYEYSPNIYDVPTTPGRGVVKYGVWELNASMNIVATILLLLGLLITYKYYQRDSQYKLIIIYGVTLLFFGLMVSVNLQIWDWLRTLSQEQFRVSMRFLALAAFGLVPFLAFGANHVLTYKSHQLWYHILGSAFAISMVFFGYSWLVAAEQPQPYEGKYVTLQNHSMQSYQPPELTWTQPGLTRHNRMEHPILTGKVVIDGFNVVGNQFITDANLYVNEVIAEQLLPERFKDTAATTDISPTANAHSIQLTHTTATVHDISPGETVTLFLLEPALSYHTTVEPADASFTVAHDPYLRITNHSDVTIKTFTITPDSPTPLWFIVVWGLSLAVIISLPTWLWLRQHIQKSSVR